MTQSPKTTNLTQLPMNRAILTMAIPASGAMVIESLYHLVDTFWVGKLGALPLAAASATSFVLWMLMSFGDLTGVAANALSAQEVGANRSERVKEHLGQCLSLALILSVAFLLIMLPLRQVLFGWLNLEVEVSSLAVEYLLPWLLGLPVIFSAITVNAAFRGVGDAKTPMLLMGIAVIFNAILDPLFIFGLGPIPGMGLTGAAWVTVAAHAVILAIGLKILRKRELLPRFSLRQLKVPWDDARRIISVGLPIALNGAFFSLIYIGLTWVIASFGSTPIAALGIGHRMEAFPWFIAYGFSIAAASLIGQYVGAGQPEQAEKAAWRTGFVALAFEAVFAVLILIWVEPIVRFFIDDPAVVSQSAVYLRIVAVCWLIGVFEVVLEGAFGGAGDTLPPLLIGVIFTALRIPAAYLFAIVLDGGIVAVWWTIGLSSAVKGALLIFWFKRGKWKRKRLV